jgi:hypothetical protein
MGFGRLLRSLDGFLRFDSELVEVHWARFWF